MGIEPTYPAWKASVLPLNYTRECDPQMNHTRTAIRQFIKTNSLQRNV